MELTSWILWMIPGAIIGIGLGYGLHRIYRKKWIPLVCMVVCMGLVPNMALLFSDRSIAIETVPANPTPPQTADEIANGIIASLENTQPSYKLLLDADPQFRQELHEVIQSADYVNRPNDTEALLTLLNTKLMKYLPYADDDVLAKYTIQKITLFSYAGKAGEATCDALINGRLGDLHLPPDLLLNNQKTEGDLLASGINGFKNGNKEKSAFTFKELIAYLDSIEKKSNGTFNRKYFSTVFDPKTPPREVCKPYSSLLDVIKNESSENIGKLWRTLEMGPKA